jgi:hypothetical protein
MPLGSDRSRIGGNAPTLRWSYRKAIPMNSEFRGRWDRNRTCALRLWRSNAAVGECRTPSPHTALPHSLCRQVSPTVAGCRRSLGHILGQPLLPRAFFSLLSSIRSAAVNPGGMA